MMADKCSAELEILRSMVFDLARGLTESELRRAEEIHRFRFPPDLRALLSQALPVGAMWPDWRSPDSPALRQRFADPSEVIVTDVKNGFWWPGWGERPEDVGDAIDLAQAALQSVPRLIPVYAHRYLPAEPTLAGNPVLSVLGTDIICYGRDLQHYLENEFKCLPPGLATQGDRRRIRFWADFLEQAPDCWSKGPVAAADVEEARAAVTIDGRLAPATLAMLENWHFFASSHVPHGFGRNMQNYEIELSRGSTSPHGRGWYLEGRYRFVFTNCVSARAETISDEVWPQWSTLSDSVHETPDERDQERLIDMEVMPRPRHLAGSPRAAEWSERLHRPMHEVTLELKTHDLRLIFHDIQVYRVAHGNPTTGTLTPTDAVLVSGDTDPLST